MEKPDFQHEYDLDSLVLVHPQTRNFCMHVTPRYRHHYEEVAFEEFSADFLSRILGRARLFIDVGAHYGFYALLAARQDSRLEVIACEPTPETCRALERNVALNRVKNVAVHQIALSDRDGTATFNVSLSSDSCSFHANPEAPPLNQISVVAKTLDSLLAQHEPVPTLIKMDTEGHELAVIKGMSATLKRFPDVQFLVEFNPLMQRAAGFGDEGLLSHLKSIGYTAFLLNEASHSMIHIESQQQLSELVAATGYANLYCVRPEHIVQLSLGSRNLNYTIEAPQKWKMKTRDLAIRGWCFGDRDIIVQAVRARRGKRVWNARYGLFREDLRKAHPGELAPFRSGFEVRVTVPIFPGWLRLEAQDQFGRWHPFLGRCVSHWRRLLRKSGRPQPVNFQPQTIADALPRIIESLHFNVCVLAVSHSDYRIAVAGTQKLLQQEEALLAARGVSFLEIHPVPRAPVDGQPAETLIGLYADSKYIGEFAAGHVRELLRELGAMGITLHTVHLHHVMGFEWGAMKDLLGGIEAKKTFFIHDFYSICPQFNLMKNDREFCGGPPVDSPSCRECSYGEKRPPHFQAAREFLETWQPEFVVPSEVARDIWLASYPNLAKKVRVVPHLVSLPGNGQPLERPAGSKIRIAYVGYQHPYKGWDEWKKVTTVISREHCEFFVLGSWTETLLDVQHVPVSFVEKGPDAMLQALRQHSIDIAFLWSLVPETYSFTLFESLAAGCFILTNPKSGNIAAQVSRTGRGWVASRLEDVLVFLLDDQQVAGRLAQFQKEFPPFELAPNPALADEIAAGALVGRPAKGADPGDPKPGLVSAGRAAR